MVTEKPQIFDYLDYRKYLADYYAWNKRRDPSFSLRYFGAQAGLKSYNYLKYVIDGERRLTETFFEPFCRALKLVESERRYFRKLIQFTEEEDHARRAPLLNELLDLRPKSELHLMDHSKLHLCEEWHYIPLIELTEVAGFVYDPKWIADRLEISVPTTKRAIRRLIEAGYLEEKGGTLVKVNRIADTRDNPADLLLQRYHSENLMVSSRKVFEQSVKEREYGSITFSVDSEKFDEIKARIKAFRKEIFELLDQPAPQGKELFQLNVQFFRITRDSA